METFRERDIAGRLRRFEQVWQRVAAARPPRERGEEGGVVLMPRRRCCRNRRSCGRM